MTFATDNLSTHAMGGTELLKLELEKRMPAELLDNFQIFVSRVQQPFDETKIRLRWCHDLAEDPANSDLKNFGWKNYHKILFVSHWQKEKYVQMYNIPASKCIVMLNAINPIEAHEKPTDKIRLGYWSTPHRGLNILVPVFEKLCETFDNIELDVFSSFELYGWKERDAPYEELFQKCKDTPGINYHGAVDNAVLREKIKDIHILAYPSIWPETSCLTLMEAMSAGCLCVHSDLAALPETAANWTIMYQTHEELNTHAMIFYNALTRSIENLYEDGLQSRIQSAQSYANIFYNWNIREKQWDALLQSLLDEDRALPKQTFSYSSLQSK